MHNSDEKVYKNLGVLSLVALSKSSAKL